MPANPRSDPPSDTMKTLLTSSLLSALLLAPASVRAQVLATPVWVDQTPVTLVASNPAVKVQADAAGNTYVAATIQNSGNGTADVALFKFGCGGAPAWARFYDHQGMQQDDRLAGMDLDPAGNVYLAVNVGAAPGGGDWVVLKYRPDGTLLWRTNYGSPGLDLAVGLAVDSRGAVAVAGSFDGGREVQAVKFDFLTGAVLEPVGVTPPNGPAITPQAMVLDGAGNVWVTGTANGRCATFRFGSRGPGLIFSGQAAAPLALGPSRGVTLAWSAAGNRVFVLASVGGDGLPPQQAMLCYRNVDARSLLLATNWNADGPIPGVFLKPPPGPPILAEGERPLALATTRDGSVITLAQITGALGSDWLLAGWNPEGHFVTERDSGLGPMGPIPQFENLVPAALAADDAGRAYVTGTGQRPPGAGLDFATVRYAALAAPAPLALEWFEAFDSPGAEDRAEALALDLSGNVYVAGSTTTVTNAVLTTLKLCQGQPENDACATARRVEVGVTAFTTCGATDTQPPPGTCGASRKDVWFRWTASGSGWVEVDTFGSCFDTFLAVYTGACGALAQVPGACNDNAQAGRPVGSQQSFVRFQAVAGVTYFIQVGAGGSNGSMGDGRLTIFGPLPPPESCPPGGTLGSVWRKFLIIGPGNSNAGGLWRVTVPNCADVLGNAPTAIGDSPAVLAAKLAASLNAACGPDRMRAVAVRDSVFLQLAGCGPDTTVLFRVGPAGTPPDQLCLVPEVGPDGVLDPAAPTVCEYNPQMAAVQVGPDCNGNGIPDEVDIASGASQDTNANSIPDECEGGLHIRRQPAGAVLFWGVPDHYLESTPSLTTPDWQWLSPTSPVVVPVTESERYFRVQPWP
jgi:hypothetical protein